MMVYLEERIGYRASKENVGDLSGNAWDVARGMNPYHDEMPRVYDVLEG